MSRDMKRLLFWVGVTLLTATAYLAAARYFYSREVACDLPCRDLGPPKEPPSAPLCNPLKLELELFKPAAKTGRHYTLWYRVKMTNVSCRRLQGLHTREFLNSDEVYSAGQLGSGLYLRVFGPDGREIMAGVSTEANGESEYGRIIPYTTDNEKSAEIFEKLGINNYGVLELPPGGSIESAPSKLEPYDSAPITVPVFDESGTIHFRGHLRVKNPGAPEPPSGFRILDHFIFNDPGEYAIQAVYRWPSVWTSAVFNFEPPLWFIEPAFFIDSLTDWEIIPSRFGGIYDVKAESGRISFEVVP